MAVQTCFSPQGRCSAHIIREIEKAQKELLIAVYAFTNDELARAVAQAQKRAGLLWFAAAPSQMSIQSDWSYEDESSAQPESHKRSAMRLYPYL